MIYFHSSAKWEHCNHEVYLLHARHLLKLSGVGSSEKCVMRSAMFFELPDLVSSRVAVLMKFVQPRLSQVQVGNRSS